VKSIDTNWQQRWNDRLVTAAEAIGRIRPEQRIFIGSGAAEPLALIEALCSNSDHLHGNEIVHLLTLGPAPYVAPELENRFRHTAFFIGANVRDAVWEGRADFMPVFLSELPALIRGGRAPIDVALVQVSPPDDHGFCSLGVAVDIVRAAVDTARLVIAEVNEHMPRTHGDAFLHARDIDAMVHADHPLPTLDSDSPDLIAQRVGQNVATLIGDGATLQVGIGSIPDAVLGALTGRRDLGIHTEMFSDGVMRLFEQGVVTGRKKTWCRGKIVTSFVMGSTDLYDWVDDNPAVLMLPSEVTTTPQPSRATTIWSPSTPRSRSISPGRSRPIRSAGASFPASAARSTSSAGRRAARAANPSSRCRRPPRRAPSAAFAPSSKPAPAS